MRQIFVWEEDEREREVIIALLEDEYKVVAFGERTAASTALQSEKWDIFIVGITGKPTSEGLHALRQLRVLAPETPILCRLPDGDPGVPTTLLRHGVSACISRTCSREELKSWLRKICCPLCTSSSAFSDFQRHKKSIGSSFNLLGDSSAMRYTRSRIELFSRYDFPVFITGESGTGKELAARSLHILSHRSNQPFIAVNCGAIPETIIESELFGTEKGAYTGAISRPGTFELANGGTLFLDEITELATGSQAKLLRVLENYEVRRLGARNILFCDVRIISATNEDIQTRLDFRFDLFERLETLILNLPPLRDRPEDIPQLSRHFLDVCALDVEVADDAMEKLIHYDWPGNVRQLKNTLIRAAVDATGENTETPIIHADHIFFGSRPPPRKP